MWRLNPRLRLSEKPFGFFDKHKFLVTKRRRTTLRWSGDSIFLHFNVFKLKCKLTLSKKYLLRQPVAA